MVILEWERFPSGQRGQTVNLLAMPSEVRILPSPPGFPVADWLSPSTFIHLTQIESSAMRRANYAVASRMRTGKFNKNGTISRFPGKRKIFSDWVLSIHKLCFLCKGGSSSVGRASAFQAEGRGFDPRFPLHCFKIILLINFLIHLVSLSV
jgi:hypothetical protein